MESLTNLELKYELLYFNTLLSQSKQKIILQRSKCHQLKSNVNWKNKHDNNERNAVPPPVFGCQENVKERYEKAKDSLLSQKPNTQRICQKSHLPEQYKDRRYNHQWPQILRKIEAPRVRFWR